MTTAKTSLIPMEHIEHTILIMRGQKVMLDSDLARLYGVETKYLKRQVQRNIERFPEDFMFQLTNHELVALRCHFGTSNTENNMEPSDSYSRSQFAT